MTDLSLLQDFVTETVEHLEEMEGNLLQLERDPADRETLNHVFRSVHTIKGAAEYLGMERIAELSHRLENLLDLMRHDAQPTNGEIIDLLMAARDRISVLTADLHQGRGEQAAIDDLLDRIDAVGHTDAVDPEKSSATAVDAGPSPEHASADPLPAEVFFEEEHDEELFSIFLEQLQEGLDALQSWTEALIEVDPVDQIELLGRCLGQIDPLQSSANYMGYDNLVDIYNRWQAAIQTARERLRSGEVEFVPDFVANDMRARITTIGKAFPRLTLSAPSAAPSPDSVTPDAFSFIEAGDDDPALAANTDYPSVAEDTIGDLDQTPLEDLPPNRLAAHGAPLDAGLLRDFVDETAEHLAEMENSLLQLESEPGNEASLNDLFRSVHTIKGAAEYMGMTRMADLAHHLENLLDLVRRGNLTAGRAVIDLLMAAGDRLGSLTTDLHQNQAEQTEIEDLLVRLQSLIEGEPSLQEGDAPSTPPSNAPPPASTDGQPVSEIYEEENDEELFEIFLDQLQEGLDALQSWTDALATADQMDRIEILGRCLGQVDPLRSSANYMGYRKLTGLYDRWGEAMRAARKRLEDREEAFLPAFIAGCMQATVDDIRSCFPSLVPTAYESSNAARKAALDAPSTDACDPAASPSNDLLDTFAKAPEALPTQKPAPEPATHATVDGTLFDRLSRSFDRRFSENDGDATHAVSSDMEWELFSKGGTTASAEPVAGPPDLPPQIDDVLTSPAGKPGEVGPDGMADENPPEEAPPPDAAAVSPSPGGDPFPTADPAMDGEALPPQAAHGEALDLDRAPGDRRDPYQRGRRKSDRIGEKLLRQSIRVDAVKIDALMNQVGELVVSRAWFSQLFHEMRDLQQNLQHHADLEVREMKQVKGLTFRLSEATVALGRVANELQEGVMKVRMLPIAQLFNRYPRLVFDLVRASDKKVALDIKGEETELDKMVIEAISDPLIHIIRNAVDHGIEPLEERRGLGKPESGTIHLEAYHEGNHVVIEIADDGRGLDAERIKAKALAGNFATREEIERMLPKEINSLIMQAGFSTAAEVTHTSGRGVGMDVVKQNIEKLNGTIEIDTTPGVGTQFRIKIPLTLAIIPALLVQVRSELFTIPLSTVEETIRIAPGDLSTIEGVEVMQLRENTLPLVRLAELFNMPAQTSDDGRSFVVVVSTGMKQVGLVVDALLGQEEVVIKPLEDYLQEKSGFSGATILGDGRISLILDIYELVSLSIDRQSKRKRVAVPA